MSAVPLFSNFSLKQISSLKTSSFTSHSVLLRGDARSGMLSRACSADPRPSHTSGGRFSSASRPAAAIQGGYWSQGQRIEARLPQGRDGPEGRPERSAHHDRRHRFRCGQHLRRPDSDAELRSRGQERPDVQRVPHHRTLFADPGCAADRPQPPHLRHGQHHGVRHGLSGLHLDHSQERRHRRQHSRQQRLQHGVVRQAPPRSGVDARPGRALRPVGRWAGLRVLLRVPRRRHGPVASRAVREHDAGAAAVRRPELHPDPRPGRSLHQLDSHAARGRPRQALLPLFRSRQQPRSAPRPEGLDRQVQGAVRPGLGQGARGDAGAAEEAGRRPGRHGAYAAPQGDSGLGFAERRSEEGLRADDGGLRRHRGAERSRDRPHPRLSGGIRATRQHARHLPRRGQRRQCRRHDARDDQRSVRASSRPSRSSIWCR